jgi:membrane-associated phospholipid phosphatase
MDTLMRFGRILLASLAPLIGFSALMNPPASGEPAHEDVIVRLWNTVVQLVAAPAPESAPAISLPHSSSLHALLPVTALSSTPLGHSLWMVTAMGAMYTLFRRPQRLLLRC